MWFPHGVERGNDQRRVSEQRQTNMHQHGRTRAGAYKAEVDYQAIARARASVKIPLIANGDIVSYEKALHVKEVTGCNSLMIGRGAVGNPWGASFYHRFFSLST